MRLSIVIFDGLTTLDAIGGYEVLARLPGVEAEFVAASRGIVAADTRRLGLVAWRGFDEVAATDILYVPGGPGAFALEKDEGFLEKLRQLDNSSTWTVGICNGVGLLGAAGMLRGRSVTTNWFYQDRLAAFGASFNGERYSRDGKYVTGAGVSASIDTGLFLASLIAGERVAKALQLGIEYYPAPPFPERGPNDVPQELMERVRKADGSTESLRLQAPFHGMFVPAGTT
ncbi:glutamine amidotransferase [Bradyrhizobium guangdongense]|uniref:DJ-1/PfpI family protein n=1 Tax=Bradyrhizobium guangdongense TaxID=1325090 RepID=UPI0011277BE1|nr:DJ-1/PfpI family protein [Bradyrhizobium guangdongense]TPQ32365.1 glutamine amidotransferase [Bradyrhizobium guangdongense]